MLADYNSQIIILRSKATGHCHHLVVMVKQTLSGKNMFCLRTVAMALHGNIGVLTMNVANRIVSIPIND